MYNEFNKLKYGSLEKYISGKESKKIFERIEICRFCYDPHLECKFKVTVMTNKGSKFKTYHCSKECVYMQWKDLFNVIGIINKVDDNNKFMIIIKSLNYEQKDIFNNDQFNKFYVWYKI